MVGDKINLFFHSIKIHYNNKKGFNVVYNAYHEIRFFICSNQIVRTTWSRLRKTDIRPDEGKHVGGIQNDEEKMVAETIGKDEQGTELSLLNPKDLDRTENDIEGRKTLNGHSKLNDR